MISSQERLQLVEDLKLLRTALFKHTENYELLKELPEPLQEEIRSYNSLNPLTSSGIEHITTIIDRINMAIFYLADPDFPDNWDGREVTQLTKPTAPPTPPSPTVEPPATPQPAPQLTSSPVPQSTSQPVPQPTSSTNSPVQPHPKDQLDFGPFDPRTSKGQ